MSTAPTPAKPSILRALLNRRMLICIVAGFSSGMPLYLLFNLLPAWLSTEGISLKEIGLFALIQVPYTWKFIWAPFLDRFSVPRFGRRRGWMLIAQLGLLVVIASMGTFAPADELRSIVLMCVALAFLSATQDVVLDAYRRELLPTEELGLGNSVFVNAYRISALVPGSLALILADHLPWSSVFAVTAVFMIPGLILSLVVREIPAGPGAPRTLRDAIVDPFREFFQRQGVKHALLILAFLFLYKIGDSMCTALATPFYLAMGFTKSEIGIVAKNAGLWPSVIGGLLGGLWMVRTGINRALWIFGTVQVGSILGFAALASMGAHAETTANDLVALAGVIGLEALGVGLGSAAFVAFMAKTTNPLYTATQLALFTSLMAVPRTVVNASTGFLVEQLGWFQFFMLCALLGVPGMLLLFRVAPWNGERPKPAAEGSAA